MQTIICEVIAMVNKLKLKNKQLEKMGIKKTKDGDYEYVENNINSRNNSNLKNNVVANPQEMQRGIEDIMGVNRNN